METSGGLPPESGTSAPGRSSARAVDGHAEHRELLLLLAAVTFLIFFQAFMIAPLLPRLAELFDTTPTRIGLAVPAYLIPYGLMTLVWGPLSDRVGRSRVILTSLVAFVVLTAATASVDSASWFVALRAITAIGASGVVPIALALIGDLIPVEARGHALGWLFGAMAGGIAVGSTAGALLEPVIGWRGLFVAVAAITAAVGVVLARRLSSLDTGPTGSPPPLRMVVRGYRQLLTQWRSARTYTYVLINAVLHSGVYTWIGLYLQRRYGLGEVGIGLAVLGYGIPGFAFGPAIGRLADRTGRARLIPLGLAIGAASALVLIPQLPVVAVAVVLAVLSLGYDLTQPLLAGIVTMLPANRGQAMGLNVFTLFVGFGLGSLLFGALLDAGFTTALAVFGGGALLAALVAIPVFDNEQVAAPQTPPQRTPPREAPDHAHR